MSKEDYENSLKMNELIERLKREKQVRDQKNKEEEELRIKKEIEEREERKLKNL